MFSTHDRVIVIPLTAGTVRRARVVDRVSDVGAYRVRYSDGTRAVVSEAQLERREAETR